MLLLDFDLGVDIADWEVVDDRVMGGMSSGTFDLGVEGVGVFEGDVSLENNGGFSMVRYRIAEMRQDPFSVISLYVRGDGKAYQFRVKPDVDDGHAYTFSFETNGDWQVVEVPLSEMIPKYRGREISAPRLDGTSLQEIAFLVGNKRQEHFRLEIDKIVLQ